MFFKADFSLMVELTCTYVCIVKCQQHSGDKAHTVCAPANNTYVCTSTYISDVASQTLSVLFQN